MSHFFKSLVQSYVYLLCLDWTRDGCQNQWFHVMEPHWFWRNLLAPPRSRSKTRWISLECQETGSDILTYQTVRLPGFHRPCAEGVAHDKMNARALGRTGVPPEGEWPPYVAFFSTAIGASAGSVPALFDGNICQFLIVFLSGLSLSDTQRSDQCNQVRHKRIWFALHKHIWLAHSQHES